MNLLNRLAQPFTAPPRLTRTRVVLALIVALGADALQWLLGPVGWVFFDQIIDVVAMILTMWLLGFHLLLLPTFVVEFLPLVDMLPTWTGCVIVVIALRKHAQRAANAPPPPAPPPRPEGDSYLDI
jgi:hypothetical protein